MADKVTREDAVETVDEEPTEAVVEDEEVEVPAEAIPGQAWRGPVESRTGGHVHYDGTTFNWTND